MMGFKTDELMSGFHEFRDGHGPVGQHPFAFRVRWGPEKLREWLNPMHTGFLWQELAGEVLVGGLCDWVSCEGTLHLDYFRNRRIRYDFNFDTGGVRYNFVGDKQNIRLTNLPVSHTTCSGVLTELKSGRLISTSVSTFKFRHLPRLLTSVRLHA